jgi:hypothetical protein
VKFAAQSLMVSPCCRGLNRTLLLQQPNQTDNRRNPNAAPSDRGPWARSSRVLLVSGNFAGLPRAFGCSGRTRGQRKCHAEHNTRHDSPGDEAGDTCDQHTARVPCAAATPSTRLAVERMPSFAPNPAARNQPTCSVRCRSGWLTSIVMSPWLTGHVLLYLPKPYTREQLIPAAQVDVT